jgi:lipoate---protein ligase
MNIRLLKTGKQSAAMNMGIDEAVLEAIASGAYEPTLRLYGWTPSAVSIGYFQSLEDELDLAACDKHGVDYVRRATGGGAVFHDAEITYSMHVPLSYSLIPSDILESYRVISNGIIFGLKKIGLEAQFVPLNDIVLKNPNNGLMQKISGNAQTRRDGIVLQHGTILLKVDVDKMFELLKVPDEKMKGKMIETIKERVTSVSDVLGREATFEEMHEVIIGGFEEAFPACTFMPGDLSEAEKIRANDLAKTKYGSEEWNKKR